MKFTFLMIALLIIGQSSIAQVIISDDGSTTANQNAVLELKSSTRPLILPVIPYNNFTNITPAAGMVCVTTGFPGFDDPAFHTLQFYMDEPGTSDDAWVPILTNRNSLGALRDVKRTGSTVSSSSYYIGSGAGGAAFGATDYNTVVGYDAGRSLTGSESNTFFGYDAGSKHTTSDAPGGNNAGANVAIGAQSGFTLTTGYGNTFLGMQADATSDGAIYFSTAIGYLANTNGVESTALGYNASTNGYHSTAIGSGAATTADNQIVLGTTAETVEVPGKLVVKGTITGREIQNIVDIAGSTYTAKDDDYTIIAQNTGGDIQVNLPDPSTCKGKIYVVKHDGGGTNNINIKSLNSAIIDGATTFTLDQPWEHVTVQSTGIRWIVIGGNY